MSQLLLSGYNGIYRYRTVPVGTTPSPTNVQATVIGSDVLVTCTAVAGATKYNFYRNDVLQVTNTSPQWMSTGLTAGTYTYKITAVDQYREEADRVSAFSSTASVTITSIVPSRLLTGISTNTITKSSCDINVVFKQKCSLQVYVSTNNPPLKEFVVPTPINSKSHNITINGLKSNTKYYINVLATFADGIKQRISTGTNITTAPESYGLNYTGMQSIDLGGYKPLAAVTDTDFGNYFTGLTKYSPFAGGAKVGITSLLGKKALKCQLSSIKGTNLKPVNRVSVGYRLEPSMTYKVSYLIYVPSNFIGGGSRNGAPYGIGKLLIGLHGGEDASRSVINPEGWSIYPEYTVLPDNSLSLALCDYSADRKNPAGDCHVLPQKLIRGTWNKLAYEVRVNSETDRTDGRIRAWQGESSTPVLIVQNKQMMSSGIAIVDRLKLNCSMGMADTNAIKYYSPPIDQFLSFADIKIGQGTF